MQNLTQYVNQYVGTGGHGHTFMGANVPFGLVQLGPTEPTRGWDWCSGYYYDDDELIGFGHMHLSGTGIGCLGDVAFLPVKDFKQTSTRFKHEAEKVHPGYYSVQLTDPNVLVELTATERCGFHRYTFKNGAKAQLALDLSQRHTPDRLPPFKRLGSRPPHLLLYRLLAARHRAPSRLDGARSGVGG